MCYGESGGTRILMLVSYRKKLSDVIKNLIYSLFSIPVFFYQYLRD